MVDLDEVVLPFLAREVAHLFPVEALAGAGFNVKGLSFAVVEPVEEILLGLSPLPLFMVHKQVGAITMLKVDHLEEVLQAHHPGLLLPTGLGFFLPLPRQFLLLLRLLAAAQLGVRRR